MIILPPRETKRLVQTNRGKIFGNLWSSFNLELQDSPGLIRVGTKMKLNTGSGTQANLGFPVAIQYFDTRMWALCGDRVFKNNASDAITAFVEDASTNFVTTYDKNYADMLTFNQTLVATADTILWSKATGSGTGAWTNRGTLTTSTNHKLCYFKKYNRLYVMDNKIEIKSTDTSWTALTTSGNYYINLGDEVGRAITMVATSDRIFIGTLKPTNNIDNAVQKAAILEWDGISNQISVEHKIESQGVLAMTLLNDIPYIMDANGVLRAFTGNSFQEVGRLPVTKEMLSSARSTFNERFIHPNGLISTKNGTILALINNLISDNAGSVNENMASGIWEWSQENGFVHKTSITYQPVATTTITDNGQNRVAKVGAIANTDIYSTSASGRGTMMCGAQYYTDASSTAFGLFVDAPIPTDNVTTTESKKFGYFVTQWIQSPNLKEIWQKVAVKYRKLLDSSDRIIVKYRTTEASPSYVDITWVNTTSFTTTTDVSALTGYEVEIIQGTGSGKCAHITSVSYSAPNYTVNLDETFTGVTTGTAKARLQAWTKVLEVSDQVTESVMTTLGKISERIQLKVCMQFTGDGEVHEVILVNTANQKLE